jgi:hypothetical protein
LRVAYANDGVKDGIRQVNEYYPFGINPNSYGAWWSPGHISNAYKYNQAWSSFFLNYPEANQSQIFQEAFRLKSIFGY